MKMISFYRLLPGLVLVIILSLVTYMISQLSKISTTLIAIGLGFLIANLLVIPQNFKAGIAFTENKLLAIAVALLGFQLNISEMIQLSPKYFLIIVLSLVVTITATLFFSRFIKVNRETSWLVASGQGICGSAAIMAAQKIVRAPSSHSGLTVVIVNFLGMVGVLITIFMAEKLLAPVDSGVFIGNTLQSMGHVVAAGFTFESSIGQNAVLVKMYRILMLVPFLLFLIVMTHRKQFEKNNTISWLQLVPKFIGFFVVFVVINSMGWITEYWTLKLAILADVLFVMAMVAIGMSIRLVEVFHSSGPLLILCSLVFAVQLAFNFWFLSYI